MLGDCYDGTLLPMVVLLYVCVFLCSSVSLAGCLLLGLVGMWCFVFVRFEWLLLSIGGVGCLCLRLGVRRLV